MAHPLQGRDEECFQMRKLRLGEGILGQVKEGQRDVETQSHFRMLLRMSLISPWDARQ